MSWPFASGDQVLEFQHQSFQWLFRVDFFYLIFFPLGIPFLLASQRLFIFFNFVFLKFLFLLYFTLQYYRIDWFDLLTVQGTFKSLLQHHSSKASILQHSAFCMIQLSHPYVTTGKTTALTICNFVDKVLSLLFNMLSSFVSFSSKQQASIF